ncbi:hypothetical protein FXE93_12385 [Vibrio cholerae]|uniref:hypothetical protein n=1 Tax=Vibrio cholerae TaxID=666 RepID=UPI0011DA6369|nr:hypothetical protein [Vibrio cholerae]TXY11224.1 hypothetical protein FXE93_12385 [Vibrio cholerae]GHY29728.1 hypothetical protein VCSRO118_0141 [Vibrio cholerae]
MNYESQTTTEIKSLLDAIDLSVSPEEIGSLGQLSEDDFRLAGWLQEEQSKPSLIRDLEREQIAVESLTARIEAILKPVRDSKKKSAAIVKEREQRQAAAREACGEICKRAHVELTKALDLHGVHSNDTTEVIAKVLAYTSLAK